MSLSPLSNFPTATKIVVLDLISIIVVSVAMLWLIKNPVGMLAFVGIVTALRCLVAMSVFRDGLPVPVWGEALFMGLCVLVGAFNDWNTVTNHQAYVYDGPRIFPALTGVPEWMLLFWGLVLRFFSDLSSWERLGVSAISDRVHGPGRVVDSAWLKVVLMAVLVLVTRQFIYRFYEDPLWSWLPFAVAIGVFIYLFRPGKIDRWMAGFFLISGPAVEAFYINAAQLHHYYLPVIGGLSVWIILWWLLAMWIWSDVSRRLFRFFLRELSC